MSRNKNFPTLPDLDNILITQCYPKIKVIFLAMNVTKILDHYNVDR